MIINTIVTNILNAAAYESIVTEKLSVAEKLDERNTVNTFTTVEVDRVSLASRY